MTFQLDARLDQDTVYVCALSLCEVRLHKNAAFPWVILVPRCKGIEEIFDLSLQDQMTLIAEVSHASQAMKAFFRAHKMNVGALGNIVSQLHIHVVARSKGDPAWPGPVWGTPFTKPYGENELQGLVKELAGILEM